MSDKKDFPHPEPPYKYKPFTRRLLAVENYLEKIKKTFFSYFFVIVEFAHGIILVYL
jgi:hypothetical protein